MCSIIRKSGKYRRIKLTKSCQVVSNCDGKMIGIICNLQDHLLVCRGRRKSGKQHTAGKVCRGYRRNILVLHRSSMAAPEHSVYLSERICRNFRCPDIRNMTRNGSRCGKGIFQSIICMFRSRSMTCEWSMMRSHTM